MTRQDVISLLIPVHPMTIDTIDPLSSSSPPQVTRLTTMTEQLAESPPKPAHRLVASARSVQVFSCSWQSVPDRRQSMEVALEADQSTAEAEVLS